MVYVCKMEHDSGQHGGEGADQVWPINPGRSKVDGPSGLCIYLATLESHDLHVRKTLEIAEGVTGRK